MARGSVNTRVGQSVWRFLSDETTCDLHSLIEPSDPHPVALAKEPTAKAELMQSAKSIRPQRCVQGDNEGSRKCKEAVL